MEQTSPEAVSIKVLLEAGAHFGHQAAHWHPKMKKYIFTQRNGIHIIDLEKTLSLLDRACSFITDIVARGGNILFVGTKKQAQEAVEQEAKRCGMPYVNQRWIGGMLTNFTVIQARIDYLVHLEDQKARGGFAHLSKKEALKLEREIQRLNQQMGGFKEMTKLPDALFIVDSSKEMITVAEARRMRIPTVAIVDTNSNPDEIDYPIPANDDAIRAVRLVCARIADAVLEGKKAQEVVTEVEGEEIPQVLTFVPEEGGMGADYSINDKGVEGED